VKKDLMVTDTNFENEIRLSPIPVFVDFWASWCIPSQMMMPVLDRLSEEFNGKVKIRKLNVDLNPKVREQYNIQGCPTFIIFKDGVEKLRKVGAQSENQLRELIDSFL